MRTEDIGRLQELVRVAARLDDAGRVAFLERAEPRRADLHDEVLSLVAHDVGRGELTAPPLREHATAGPYRLLGRLGEAPPARLFRGEVGPPDPRPVLVAVAGPGPAAASVAAALRDQARCQEALRDRAFARLLDAGATPDGRLYLAFEPTDGLPLAELCDALRLAPVERVELVERAALAVERAHSAGIVPLGLAPWSILGTWRDGRPDVALIAVDSWPLLALLEPERPAQSGLLACLEASAPEALRGEARGAATDVFALGALLFEAASGTPPLGLERLAGRRSLREELRHAARVTPPRVSDRVAALGRAADEHARLRSTDPSHLVRELRGGLDAIVARALSPDPGQRQPGAGALAAELAAWRSGGPRGLVGFARRLGRRFGRRSGLRAESDGAADQQTPG